MSERAKVGLFVGCVMLLVLSGLVSVGVVIESDWATFVPDLIIGVVGATVIGLVLFALQQSSDRNRSLEADVSSAYLRFLDAMTPLRILDMQHGDPNLLSIANTRAVQLWEAVVPDDAALGRWFEGERQLGLFRALRANEASQALPENASADEVLDAAAPFHQWVAEFTSNVRYWRGGKLTAAEMTEQAERIEKLLRAAGAWRDKSMPWRDDE